MRFEVPQFIEIEDKIFGPFTLKQFIYLAGAGGLAFMIFRIFPSIIAFVLIAPVLLFGFALAFYKYNSRPFISVLESGFNYYIKGKLFIWNKTQKTANNQVEEMVDQQAQVPQMYVPKMSDSKLKDLSWSLDITERERGEVL